MQQLHERLSAQAEHFETAGPEDDNLQKETDRAMLAGLLRRATDIVRVHETGERIAQVFDLQTHTFKPQTVHGCAMVERERTGELVAIPRRIYDELEDRLCERVGQLRHAQAVAESLWHTLKQIAALDPGDNRTKYMIEVKHLAARRTDMIADLPADEKLSDGAWLGLSADAPAESTAYVGIDHAAPGAQDETVVSVIEDGHVRENWREGDRCTVNGEGSEVFKVLQLGERSALLENAKGRIHGRESYRKMRRAAPAMSVIGPGWALCQVSSSVCRRSRSASKAMLRGARSATMASKPFQNVALATPVPGSTFSSIS